MPLTRLRRPVLLLATALALGACHDSPDAPPQPPPAPTGLTATAGPDDASITVTWQPVEGATSYNLYWSDSPATPAINGTKVTGATSPFVHRQLTKGRTYTYVVTAERATLQSVPSNEASAMPRDVPPPITGLRALTGPARRSVLLQWDAAPNQGDAYRVYFSTAPGVTPANGTRIDTQSSEPRFLHESLDPSRTYYYVVAVVRGGVEGPPSAEVSAVASGDLSVSIRSVSSPGGPCLSGTVRIAADVGSTLQLTEVRARVASIDVPLAFDPAQQAWIGTLPATGAPRGRQDLVVTATDVSGARAVESRSVCLDEVPAIQFLEPAEGVVGDSVRLHVLCVDDPREGCVTLWVRIGTDTIARGTTVIDTVVSLARYAPSAVLVAEGGDSLYRQRDIHQSRSVVINQSPRLRTIATVPGRVIDVRGDRVLYIDSTASSATLRVRPIAGGTDVVVRQWAGPGLFVDGALFAAGAGAIFVEREPGNRAGVIEWRAGVATRLGPYDESFRIDPDARWAIWVGASTLYRRDLVAAQTVVVTDQAPNAIHAIAPNGDVAYWSLVDRDIHLYSNGTDVALTTDPDDVAIDIAPATDGTNVAWRRVIGGCASASATEQIQLRTGAGVVTLDQRPANCASVTEWFYQLAGGWTAFIRLGTGGVLQVWRRSPGGSEQQLSFLGVSSYVEAISPDGQVVFAAHEAPFERRIARPGAAPEVIGTYAGVVRWRDGRFVVLFGSTVSEIVP